MPFFIPYHYPYQMLTNLLLVEKYRPSTLDDCILPDRIKKAIKDAIQSNTMQHMIFHGPAGTGKTSLAKAICNDIGADLMYINASNETGIDVVRTKVLNFASTSSFDGNLKVVLLDEFERMSSSAQDSLKAIQEMFSESTRFIMTSNNQQKIIAPILSRSVVFDFTLTSAERDELIPLAFKRVVGILKAEKIAFDPKSVASLIQKHYPDMRKTLNEIQRYSANGTIDAGILVQENTTTDELIEFLKNKKFTDVRKWLARNPDLDHQQLFRYFYDNLTTLFQPKSIPEVVLLIGQYQYYASRVVDQEINMMACLIELVKEAEWK